MTTRLRTSDKIRKLAQKGLTQSEASRKLGVSRQRVSQLAAKLGLAFRPGIDPIPRKDLEALAKSGRTMTEAAGQLGVSPDRVRKMGEKHNISFTPAWAKPKPAETELGKIIQKARLDSGYTYAKLGALTGLHKGHVKAIERGWVKRPNKKSLGALARCLSDHTSYEELARAALPKEQAKLQDRLEALTKRGLTRPEVAKKIGIPRTRVAAIGDKLGLTFAPFRRQPKAPSTEFGEVIQKARLASGYSYSRLAAVSGLHRRHVMVLEAGRIRHPKEKTLRTLAASLNGKASYKKLVEAVREDEAPERKAKRPGGNRKRRTRAKTS